MKFGMDNLVSIIIPCYNCASLVVETLDSLKGQTYKNIELICINDGSKDNTHEVLDDYKKNNPELNIVVIDQENHGVSYTRNCGIKISKGDYLAFVDSDDIVNKYFIELLLHGMLDNNKDTAYCRLSRNLKKIDYEPTAEIKENQDQSKAMSYLLYRMPEFGFYCYLYKKSILFDNNILFDENTKIFEDREFNWKYLANCHSACFIDECLYGYRINEQSVLHQKIDWTTDSIEAAIRVENYLRDNNIPYYSEVKKYLVARVVWSMAKNYAVNRRKDLLKRLDKEYNVKEFMKMLKNDRNLIVKISSFFYLIHPFLFYSIIKIKR